MWIGWTMLITPAPEPLEDFDFDEEEVTEKKEEQNCSFRQLTMGPKGPIISFCNLVVKLRLSECFLDKCYTFIT